MRALLARLRDRTECMRVNPLLQSYLDGQLDDQQAIRVSRHLDACRRCGMDADVYREVKAGLSRLAEPPDPDAVARLQRFVDDLGGGD